MNLNTMRALMIGAGLCAAAVATNAAPPSTSFTYQGSLAENGSAANGTTSMSFRLWDAVSGGSQVGSTINRSVEVLDGVFSESLDFGAGAYAVNQALWLEITVDGQSLGRTPLNASPFALNTRGLSVDTQGKIGVGTSTPGAPLETVGAMRVLQGSLAQGGAGLEFNYDNSDGGIISAYNRAEDTPRNLRINPFGGMVGIGTISPGAPLETVGAMRVLQGSLAQGGAGLEFNYDNSDGGIISAYNRAEDTPRNLRINPFGGMVGIGTINPQTTLDVNGAITIRGGADLVEGFDSECTGANEPGTVLSIDPDNPGKLMCSTDAYDRKVAGVVSGANGVQPGIRLGQDGVMDGDIPVAMTGRVYVKASAENGAIEPGDRLTTASLAGHAMKVTNNELSDGAVIGKAMTGLDEGTGMVLVLINLQ